MREMDRRGFTEKENALVAFAGLDGASPTPMILGRQQLTGLPDSLVISEKGTLTWSPDHSKIFVGLKEQEARPQPPRDSTAVVEPVGNVDVWHWKDPYIQSVQMVRAQQDRNRTFTATVCSPRRRLFRSPTRGWSASGDEGEMGGGSDDKEYVDDEAQLSTSTTNANTGERTAYQGQEPPRLTPDEVPSIGRTVI